MYNLDVKNEALEFQLPGNQLRYRIVQRSFAVFKLYDID